MDVGKKYIVTKPSSDGTFQLGDHIYLEDDGTIVCKEAQGWIQADEVLEALAGVEVEIDDEWRWKHVQDLIKELDELNFRIAGGMGKNV